MNGAERIAAERQRQVTAEGWSPEHDAQHGDGELALAAVCYASPVPLRGKFSYMPPSNCGCREAACPHQSMFPRDTWRDPWPWEKKWDKREKHDEIRRLEIAGALIAAEIDRLLGAAASEAAALRVKR